jgi:glycosyltransferase involved in cell wall biosynthesis
VKVLQVSPAYYPALSFGGPIMTTLALNRLLCKNHQVTTLTTPLGLDPAAAAGIRYATPLPSPCGSTLIYQPYSGYQHFTWSPATLAWLRTNAKHFDVVMLQGVWNFPLMAAAWVCQRRGIPYLVFPHGTLSEEAVHLRSGLKKRVMLSLFVRRMLERAARIVFNTPYEVRKVQSHLHLAVTPAIIPNIVDAAEFSSLPARGALRRRLGIADDTIVLLHLGRVAPVKRLTATIGALARLRAQRHKVVLVVVGGDEAAYQAQVSKLASELGIAGEVFFTGLLGREASVQAMVDADVFVLPSMSENFGMAVAEAMLAQLPVIVSDNVGLAEDVAASGAGLVVPLADGDNGLAEAIASLIADPARRARMGEAGRAFASAAYSEAGVSAHIEQLLVAVKREVSGHAA